MAMISFFSIDAPWINPLGFVWMERKKLEGRKLRGKSSVERNRVNLYFSQLHLNERKIRRKENGTKMIFPYLFRWKSEKK